MCCVAIVFCYHLYLFCHTHALTQTQTQSMCPHPFALLAWNKCLMISALEWQCCYDPLNIGFEFSLKKKSLTIVQLSGRPFNRLHIEHKVLVWTFQNFILMLRLVHLCWYIVTFKCPLSCTHLSRLWAKCPLKRLSAPDAVHTYFALNGSFS